MLSGPPAVAGRPAPPLPGAAQGARPAGCPRPQEARGHLMVSERDQETGVLLRPPVRWGSGRRATTYGLIGWKERSSISGYMGFSLARRQIWALLGERGGLLRRLPFRKNKGMKPVCKDLKQAVLYSVEINREVGDLRIEGDLGNQENLTCVSRGRLRVTPGRKQHYIQYVKLPTEHNFKIQGKKTQSEYHKAENENMYNKY